ncbi:MAG: helix-turn-helix transcriptional regulator [Ruminococcus sp.]|nr:helix-turn-helix transcriptional regulator [Ruminococcus sp.]
MIINSVGVNSVHGNGYSVEREEFDGEYMLIFMKSGGVFQIDGKTEKAENDSVIIYDRTAVQKYGADGGLFIYDWICFSTDGDADFVDSLELPFNRLIHYVDGEFIGSTIRNAASEFYSTGQRRAKMIDALMKTLLIRVNGCVPARGAVQQNADPHYSVLVELREKLYRNPQRKWNVDSMAADVNMSRSYFQHIYSELFGVSCISDLISSKIEKAKELLTETSCTISQVAAMCGYDNAEHFMRQFKKNVGVTPTAFRKKS